MSGAHSKKTYIVMFFVLTVLTALEVGLKYLPISHGLMVLGLIAFALAKASLVALYFMHLKAETRTMRLVVGIPLMFPALYALVLVYESLARSLFT